MRLATFTIESLIRLVADYTGEQFETVGEGKKMRLQLLGEDGLEFSAKGRTEITRYLQGMVRAGSAIDARGAK